MCTLLLLLTHWMRVKDVFARTADETMATETAANGAKGLVSTRRKKQLIRTMHCIVQEYNMEQCGTKCKVHRRLLLDSRLKRSATASPTTTKRGANWATPTGQRGHHSQPGGARNRTNRATGQDCQPAGRQSIHIQYFWAARNTPKSTKDPNFRPTENRQKLDFLVIRPNF